MLKHINTFHIHFSHKRGRHTSSWAYLQPFVLFAPVCGKIYQTGFVLFEGVSADHPSSSAGGQHDSSYTDFLKAT